MPNEDAFPKVYPYAWSKESDLPLADFLTKYKPSLVQDDGTKPWIWVRASEPAKTDVSEGPATEEALEFLKNVTDKVESIKNDDSIPTRSNKKTGAKSKKELREQVQAEATEKLKEISTKHGYVSGKWLIFAPGDKVDMIWSKLATSLVSGPLSETAGYLAKVATCPKVETPNYQHVICLYMPDVYDKDAVTEVMKVLLRNHGATLSGVKSNLYTSIGLDSKHPSGIPSTVWKNATLLDPSTVKELKDAFFAGINEAKAAKAQTSSLKPADAQTDDVNKTKAKPKLKKKAAEDDPFASDEEQADKEVDAAPETKKEPQGKGKGKRTKQSGADEGDEGRKEGSKKKRAAKA